MTAKLDQAGLFRVQRQRELLEPVPHRVPEAPDVTLVLETDDCGRSVAYRASTAPIVCRQRCATSIATHRNPAAAGCVTQLRKPETSLDILNHRTAAFAKGLSMLARAAANSGFCPFIFVAKPNSEKTASSRS
jgi:hypothetical protein